MKRFKNLPRKWKIVGILLLLAYILVWFGFGFFLGRKSVEPGDVGTFKDEKVLPTVANTANPINGQLFTEKEARTWKDRLPLAVVIENHLDARPQSGLNNAEIVYEALAEGGITRFLAVFLAEDSQIGPVRSNRPYFLDWVSEYSAGYAHVGGSPEAQSLISTYKIKDLDQFFLGSPTYTRVDSRPAPHNVYSTTAKLRSAASSRGYNSLHDITSWQFGAGQILKSKRPKSFTLDLGFLGAFGYDVRWMYDPNSNIYNRFNGGAKHIDHQDNKQIFVKTIIVQYVDISPDPSGHSRIKTKTTGSGKALVFQNGQVASGTWKKDSRTSRTKFVDKSGKEILLNRGRIWLEIVPNGSSVSYK